MLVQNLIKGDADAFDEIFRMYNLKLYHFSLRNLRNRQDAEGIVQEVFYYLWKDRAKLKEVKNLNAWIFTICFKIIRNHFRKLAREQKYISQLARDQAGDDSTTVTEIEYNNLMAEVDKIINNLPTRQKDIYLLSKRRGLSNEEISKQLNISKKTVENYLSRAKAFLRKAIVDKSLLTVLFVCLFID